MSDGRSDARAINELANDVEVAAWRLRDALKAAETGYRGLRPANLDSIVNDILRGTGWELRRRER